VDGITMKERSLYAHIFGIDPERVRGCRRWVLDSGDGYGVEADILVQGVTDVERETLTMRLPCGWRVVGLDQWL